MLLPTLTLPRRWSLGSREAGSGVEQWRLVRSGSDPPVFRLPRKGERPMFCPLWGCVLENRKMNTTFHNVLLCQEIEHEYKLFCFK